MCNYITYIILSPEFCCILFFLYLNSVNKDDDDDDDDDWTMNSKRYNLTDVTELDLLEL